MGANTIALHGLTLLPLARILGHPARPCGAASHGDDWECRPEPLAYCHVWLLHGEPEQLSQEQSDLLLTSAITGRDTGAISVEDITQVGGDPGTKGPQDSWPRASAREGWPRLQVEQLMER